MFELATAVVYWSGGGGLRLRSNLLLKPLPKILIGVVTLSALIPLHMVLSGAGQSGSIQIGQIAVDLICGALALIIVGSVALWCLKKEKVSEAEKPGPIDYVDIRKAASTVKHVEVPKRTVEFATGTGTTGSANRQFKKICLSCGSEFPDEFVGKCPDDKSELSRIVDRMAPGTVFSEYYEIVGPLGSGGLSKVYEVKHLSSHKRMAIKLMHSHLCKDEISLQRFQREARALSKLSHPNLVSVEDFMISPDGVPFIVMDLLEGESLQEMLTRGGAISWQETVPIFIQICKGLSHAHAKGIIHRDLKPGNVMLVPTPEGVLAKLVDFGLAKDEGGDSIGRLTGTGDVFGSPKYMSPEQCTGKKVDRRSDVYAVGCLIFECVTGNAPFIGKNVIETLSQHMNAKVPEISPSLKVPGWLIEVVHRSLKKEPEQRYQSIDDLGGALQDGYARFLKSK